MYGYRLTEDDSPGPSVYYNITFGVGSAIFTYPEWTVRYKKAELGSQRTQR